MSEAKTYEFKKYFVDEKTGFVKYVREGGPKVSFRCSAAMFDGPSPDSITVTATGFAEATTPDSKREQRSKEKAEKKAAKEAAKQAKAAEKQEKQEAKTAEKIRKAQEKAAARAAKPAEQPAAEL